MEANRFMKWYWFVILPGYIVFVCVMAMLGWVGLILAVLIPWGLVSYSYSSTKKRYDRNSNRGYRKYYKK